MALVKKSAEVPYTPEQMFDLVNNIEEYPNFLPGCQASTVFSRTENEVKASIHLAKGGVRQSFTTLNRLQPGKMIEVRLVEGPFRHLEGYWRFDALPLSGCRIQFDLEFVLANRLLDMTVGPIIEGIANKFVEAFCERAKSIYGSGQSNSK